MSGDSLNVGIAFAAGLLSFVTPCVLPLVPTYLAFITGVSVADLREREGGGRFWKRGLVHSLMFVAGFSLVFVVVLGGLVTAFQSVVVGHREWVARIGGAIIILLGLHFAGWLPIRFLDVEKRLELGRKPVGYLGSLLVGVVFAAGWTPCCGPILGAIVTLAAASKTSGFVMLSAYSAGLGLPFVATALAVNAFISSFQRVKRHLRWLTMASGVLLIVVGLLMVGGVYERLGRMFG